MFPIEALKESKSVETDKVVSERPKRAAAVRARNNFEADESLEEADFEGFELASVTFNESSEKCDFEGF